MSEYTSLWLNHGFELFAALNINFIFNLLLGQLGVIINVPVMMIQIVSGAGLIPYLILPNFFKFMSNISPTYYAIQSDYNILGDRMNIANNLLLMLVLGLGSIICHLIIVALKKFQTETATI
jgi:ABC-type multidrug transport system permease subunit